MLVFGPFLYLAFSFIFHGCIFLAAKHLVPFGFHIAPLPASAIYFITFLCYH